MQKKHRKKGFTLTELAIVIAVIAILIAVLVPTFISLLSSANTTADEQAVKSMNDILSTSEITDEKNVNPKEAMEVLKENGINVENYSALDSDNTIYWNSETNRVLLYSKTENAVIYPADAASKYTNLVADNLPKYWYLLSEAYKTTTYNSTLSFAENVAALASGETLQLQDDVTLSWSSYSDSTESTITIGSDTFTNVTKLSPFTLLNGEDITVDLNGNSLTISYGLTYTNNNGGTSATYATYLTNNSSLYFKNGTLSVPFSLTGSSAAIFNVQSGSSLTLEDVTVEGTGSVIYPQGNAAQVNIINSTVTTDGAYCIATNAGKVDNYDVIVNISNSTLISNITAVCFNVPGTYIVKDSTIATNDGSPCFIARGGDITIDNCIIATSLQQYTYVNSNSVWNKFMDDCEYTTDDHLSDGYYKKWQSGNGTPYAALCIGNDADSNAYQYYTKCTVTNTQFHTGQGFMCVYVEGNNTAEYGATFNYSNCSFYYHVNESGDTTTTVLDDINNGIAFSNVTPTKYSTSLYDTNNYKLDYAIIYSSDESSYVTINGTVYQDGN